MKTVFVLIVASILLFGCTTTEVKEVTSTPTNIQQATAGPSSVATQQNNPITSTPTPVVKTFKVAEVGQSLTNNKLEITLNSIYFMEEIPSDNKFLRTVAKEGKTFAVVDVTVQNLDKEATTVSSIIQFKVKDADGYAYDQDFSATLALDQQVDGTLQPGEKIRGKLAFDVPKNAKQLQLIFNFAAFDLAQGKFNLGDVKNIIASSSPTANSASSYPTSTLASNSLPTYASCGAEGEKCCLGTSCNSGLGCLNGNCARCGDINQQCCSPDALLMQNLGCKLQIPTMGCVSGTCQYCGREGEQCCPNQVCDTGKSCEAGVCTSCGGVNEKCCPPSNAYICLIGACVDGICTYNFP